MSDELPTTPTGHTDAPAVQPQAPRAKSYGAFVAAILIGLVIIGGCGYLVWKYYKAKPAPAPQTVAEIQQEFTPPAGFKPTFNPPAPTAGPQLPPEPPAGPLDNQVPSSQPNYPNSQGSFPSAVSGSPRGPASTAETGQTVAGAQTPPYTPPAQFVQTPKPIYQPYIETYPANNITLDDIKTILQDSPSVTSVTDTTYQGQPALKYTAADPKDSGIAYISANTIYYVHGS